MKQFFLEQTICYDGTQLRSHWILDQIGEVGDAIAAFIGPADVSIKHMVDLVDVRNNAPIFSRSMLHFIAEHFGCDLEKGILRQRLLIALAKDLIESMNNLPLLCKEGQGEVDRSRSTPPDLPLQRGGIVRKGNDLYDGDRKLSVSIAAASPVSCCIHFALNIESQGTLVPTKGFQDYGIDPKSFALQLMTRYTAELHEINLSRCKVRAIT